MARTENPSLIEHAAYVTGTELRAVGINMNLAPVVDVNNNPRNPVINNRSFGDTPEKVIAFGQAALKGYHEAGIISSLKHFPGYGDVEVDPHLALPCLNKSLEQLEQTELAPFKALAPYADTIMTAHIEVPALDPSSSCATVSKKIVDHLRNDMGFHGVVLSDSLVMEGVLTVCGTADEAAIRALNAGCDMLILGGRQLVGAAQPELNLEDIRRIHQSLVNAVREGRIREERLDQAVGRILALKHRYELEPSSKQNKFSNEQRKITEADARQIAKKIWKNECNGLEEGLTHWNSGEDFGSFGIGHFIWYPKDRQGPFVETFPELVSLLKSRGVKLPAWLEEAQGCPWKSQVEFNQARQSSQMQALRKLLVETTDLQALFIASRLERALPDLVSKAPTENQPAIRHLFYQLASTPEGLFALIDYCNFKGEGVAPSETYKGHGWGLLQVLQRIPSNSKSPLNDFVKAAKIVLIQRVENSDPAKNERRWLRGWFNRLDSY